MVWLWSLVWSRTRSTTHPVRLDGRVDVAEVRDAIEIRAIPITR